MGKRKDLMYTNSNSIDKRCLPRILEAYEGKFHFLFEEEAEENIVKNKRRTHKLHQN